MAEGRLSHDDNGSVMDTDDRSSAWHEHPRDCWWRVLSRRLHGHIPGSSSSPPDGHDHLSSPLAASPSPLPKGPATNNWSSNIAGDVISGLSVGCMVIPQSISYAAIAGLPTEYGLYTASIPTLTYSLLGSSRQLAVGPVAVMSLLLSSGLSRIVQTTNDNPNSPTDPAAQEVYNRLAVQASLLVGVMCMSVGALHLGFLTDFLSHAVISGFSSGAAIIISVSQLRHIVGFPIRKSPRVYEPLWDLLVNMGRFRWYECAMSAVCTAILMGVKRLSATYRGCAWAKPMGPLAVTILSTLLVRASHLDVHPGVKVVGPINGGLPSMTVGWWLSLDGHLAELLPLAATMAAVGLLESFAIAKTLAEKNNYSLEPNRELLGLGAANVAGAMFGAYPCTGSFSRSAVANETGARTSLASAVTALMVLLTTAYLLPLFAWMPYSALATIVIGGVMGLVDFSAAARLWQSYKRNFTVWMTAFWCTLLLGVELGLACAVVLDLQFLLWHRSRPEQSVAD